MTDTTTDFRPTYGNWIAARSPGLFGAGIIGTLVLFAGIISALLGLLAGGLPVAAVIAGLTVVAFAAVGTPAGAWVTRRAIYTRSYLAKDHQWRSGVLSKNPQPFVRLPGHLAGTKQLTGTDAQGQPFVVVKSPAGLYTIVARCLSEGPQLQDRATVDAWVAGWAILLSSCASETGLVCMKAITETAPDPGGRLPDMVTSMRSENSPQLARMVMDTCAAELPATSSENVTYLELTYRGRAINRKGDEAAILGELGRKVPSLIALAQSSGGGSVDMMTPEDLARTVRVAYDPAVQPAIEQAELRGDPEDVEWEDAGPVAYQDLWGDFIHDSGHSITWEMVAPPKSRIIELAMAGLLAPQVDVARKRVCIIFRPHTADQSARVAEQDASTANFVAQQSKKRPSAAAQLVMKAAEQSRQEVAAGAASVRFSIMVTATVLSGGDVAQAVSTLEARARAVPMRIRRCYGSQAAAFATTLPVGFVPFEHSFVSSKMREYL